jgi:hypothetical protein
VLGHEVAPPRLAVGHPDLDAGGTAFDHVLRDEVVVLAGPATEVLHHGETSAETASGSAFEQRDQQPVRHDIREGK